MLELLAAAFAPLNIVYTTLFMVVILYWITVFVGIFDLKSFNIDKNLDFHAEKEINTSESSEAAHHHLEINKETHIEVPLKKKEDAEIFSFGRFLVYFNLGSVPFMVFMSFLILFTWAGSILGNHYIGKDSGIFALFWTVPNLLAGLGLTKLFTQPLKPFFKDKGMEFNDYQDIIGKTCKIILSADDQKAGQAELASSGSPLLLRIKATEGNQLKKGEQGLIINYDESTQIYLVEPF